MKIVIIVFFCLLLCGCNYNIEAIEESNYHGEILTYYGVLIIPKINMYLGFYDENNKNNDVNKNVMLINTNIKNTYLLAAHSGTGKLAYFNDLRYLDIGDEIILKFNNKVNHYIVSSIRNEVKNGKINIKMEENQVILTTCNQIKKGYQLIVEGNLVN